MRKTTRWTVGLIAVAASIVVFILPFFFILLTSAKTAAEASQLEFSWPSEWAFTENLIAVLADNNNMLPRAFLNSTILTVSSVSLMVILGAMVGYVLQRRASKWNPIINGLVLAGLIVPPAVVPTIWAMQSLGIFKTIHGMVLIEVTFGLSFCVLLFRAFMSTIPRELDEAAIIDGVGPVRLFFSVIFPLLRPVAITVIIVQSVAVFNDFVGPLYFLPGDANVTVQLTLYNYQSQTLNQWNLLFMNILLITIPPLIAYIFFNRQIVSGMTSGAIKG